MRDAELYMKLQNSNYSLSYGTIYNANTGICYESSYRNYVEQMYDNKYMIGEEYYIDYEEYADKLSYFSNILSVY